MNTLLTRLNDIEGIQAREAGGKVLVSLVPRTVAMRNKIEQHGTKQGFRAVQEGNKLALYRGYIKIITCHHEGGTVRGRFTSFTVHSVNPLEKIVAFFTNVRLRSSGKIR